MNLPAIYVDIHREAHLGIHIAQCDIESAVIGKGNRLADGRNGLTCIGIILRSQRYSIIKAT